MHPDGAKESTQDLPVERMPFVDRYVIPLSQHIGAPAEPTVAPGERVRRGQRIARAGGFISTNHHAPVTGTVVAIGKERYPSGELVDAIVIQIDRYDLQRVEESGFDWRGAGDREFVDYVQGGGLVGLGGAAFPSHVKLSLPEGRGAEHLVINGAECEPYLTCDHRTMIERPDDVLRGVDIAGTRLGVSAASVGIELNKPQAIAAMEAAVARRSARIERGEHDGAPFPVRVVPARVKYPQGAEKLLIKAMFDREVPAGSLPLDLGYVVNNVGTMVALTDRVDRGRPLIERVVTVSGPGVARPANLLVPLGTPIRAVLEACGGLRESVRQVVMGGPMMGVPIANLSAPVIKGTSGILAFEHDADRAADAGPCIKCGQCLQACPYMLNPSRLGRLARAGRALDMEDWRVLDCMECGACTWACPSDIPLTQLFRAAKQTIRRSREED